MTDYVHPVPEDFATKAVVKAADYQAAYAESVRNPGGFWAGIAKRINDLADRARTKKLKPDEVAGATFSITNPGVLGTMVGMPIIPEGTAAILGTGAIEKRVVVVQDADGNDVMAIRKRSFFSLGYDHRLVDGADAARFLAKLKLVMESFPEDA